jgi:hypothetical protein
MAHIIHTCIVPQATKNNTTMYVLKRNKFVIEILISHMSFACSTDKQTLQVTN